MGQHRRPGSTGGPAREHQHGDVIGLDVGDRNGSAASSSSRGTAPSSTSPSTATTWRIEPSVGPVDVVPRRRRLRSTTTASAPTSASSRSSSARRARRVQRHDDGAETERGEVGDDERMAVAADERDPVTVARRRGRRSPPRSRAA